MPRRLADSFQQTHQRQSQHFVVVEIDPRFILAEFDSRARGIEHVAEADVNLMPRHIALPLRRAPHRGNTG